VTGLLAITGTPPFSLFLSEFLIVRAAIDAGRLALAAAFLALLAWIFAAMSGACCSWPRHASRAQRGRLLRAFLAVAPPAALASECWRSAFSFPARCCRFFAGRFLAGRP